MATLVAIVPVTPTNRIERLRKTGWQPGRTNGYTLTLSRRFADAAEATKVGRALPPNIVWAIEDVVRI